MTEKKVSTNKVLTWLSIILGIFLVIAVIAVMQAPKEIIVEKEIIKEVIVEVEVPAPVVPIVPVVPTEVVEESTIYEKIGYLIDELFLSVGLTEETYSDREINLFDGEVEFAGDDYDAEETLILKDIKLMANENDYEGNVYMTLLEGAVEYKLVFENDLNTSLIDEDDTLEFEFLGMNYEISNWDDTEVTLTKGSEEKLLVGETITIDGKEVSLFAIDESGEKASITVGDEEKVFVEGQTKTVNDLEIKVDTIFDSETASYVRLVVGEEVETTIETTDEYEEDSAWNYVITANTIGIILVEEHSEVDLDGDEEFQAFAKGEVFYLPNEYLGIVFNGMLETDTEEYNLELDEKSSVEYVRVDGNFESGLEDYDRVYVRTDNQSIYNRDLEFIHASEIELANTDSKLITNATGLFFEDFNVNYALDTTNVGTGDEEYLTDFGIKVMNPEDSVEDQEFNIFVPEEKLEGSISLI